MPTYAYVCTACDHAFEAVQAITDEALTSCPSCGGSLRKKFHPVGVTFKGSGFYRTDSRTGTASSNTPAAASGTGEGKSGSSSSDSGTSSSDTSSTSSTSSSGSTSSGSSPAGATGP